MSARHNRDNTFTELINQKDKHRLLPTAPKTFFKYSEVHVSDSRLSTITI